MPHDNESCSQIERAGFALRETVCYPNGATSEFWMRFRMADEHAPGK